jgi:predicted glycogen debranching enzyme
MSSKKDHVAAAFVSPVDFGREICGELPVAEQREWLVTNGMGGFACGTIAGLLTRRYHGLLVAALKPPLGRTLLVTKFDETVEYDGRSYPLSTNRWVGGTLDPQGFQDIERFRLEGTTPVWTFALADAQLEKRIWMQPDANSTYVQYRLLRAGRPVKLEAKILVNYREFHGNTHAGDWRMQVEAVERGLRVVAFQEATPFYILSTSAIAEPAHEWYRNFDLAVERSRGLDDHEDHLHAGTFRAAFEERQSITFVCSTDPQAELDGVKAYETCQTHQRDLLARWSGTNPRLVKKAPGWVRQLVLAADQFVVKRPLTDVPHAHSVIAGYPWFSLWGRDATIALPGLTLATGRADTARNILRTFARFVDRGMLPNVFRESEETPAYNTVDATLWYVEAVRQYVAATGDSELLRELFPVLVTIIDWHIQGTRYNIHVDPEDGLLHAGEPGVQLTWMDAKVDDKAVTPRTGKPIEVNALWLNALVSMAQIARALSRSAEPYESRATRVGHSFQRFWNESGQYCFDVLDGPEGNDASLRPNQIFAVSLPESALTREQQRAVVDTCARYLLTSHGLRSLAPNHPDYRGRYVGDPRERNRRYHQGTVWGWLLGPFALAYLRVYRDRSKAALLLEPIQHHLQTQGLGSASEIFDGDAPFVPRGCIAQAWTVAEVLRAWTAIAGVVQGPKRAKVKKAGQA